MSINLLTGALSALIIQQRTQNNEQALAGGALSAMTPGLLSLAIPLVIPVPPTGTTKGGTITGGGTTAKPPVYVTLENVVGTDKDAAQAAITAQNMKVTLTPVVVESAAGAVQPPLSQVVKQVPAAGELTAVGTHVHLFYAVAAASATQREKFNPRLQRRFASGQVARKTAG